MLSLLYIFRAILFFFFNGPPTTEIYTLSLHDALPIFEGSVEVRSPRGLLKLGARQASVESRLVELGAGDHLRWLRSEEHTSELQSPVHLVCRLLLEKKKKNTRKGIRYTHTTSGTR